MTVKCITLWRASVRFSICLLHDKNLSRANSKDAMILLHQVICTFLVLIQGPGYKLILVSNLNWQTQKLMKQARISGHFLTVIRIALNLRKKDKNAHFGILVIYEYFQCLRGISSYFFTIFSLCPKQGQIFVAVGAESRYFEVSATNRDIRRFPRQIAIFFKFLR